MNTKFTVILCLLYFFNSSSSAQWVKTNGPEGISVTSFFEGDNYLLLGTNAQGVYRSSDNGNSWVVSSEGLENKRIACFAKDDIYIYTGSFNGGVFRSPDNGYTWQPANTGIQNEAVFSLLEAGGYLFAGTVRNGIFRSADHGNTWVDMTVDIMSEAFIKAMVYSAPRLMVEADNYIFYSYDLGNTWDVDQGPTQFYQIYDFFQKGDTLFASGFHIIFRSTDGGVTWSNPYFLPYGSSVVGFSLIDNTLYAGTGDGMFSTIDWGLSWVQIPATGLRTGGSDFIVSGNNFLLGREEIGIALSADLGNSWTSLPLSQFARASSLDDAMTVANGILYVGTHGNGVFSSPDQGNTWSKIGTTNQFDTLSREIIFSILHIESNIILAGGCGDGLFRSADNGVTWTHITAGLPVEDAFGDSFTCVHTLAKCGPNILAACWMGVYYSTDNGLTWNPTNLLSPPSNGYLDAGGFAIRDNIACVGISSFPMQGGVYRSTDYGVSWTLADPVADIMFMATGGGSTMYAGELFTSYVSHDDGLTWQGLGLGAAFAIIAWDQYAFIGNNNGVFFSNDFGDNWTVVNEGMDPYPNNAVDGFARDDEYVYAGLYRDAVWRRPLSDFNIAPPPCPTMVTSTADSGSGSLRDAIACAANGATITFDAALADQTITLTSGEIVIKKNLILSGLGMTHLTISGSNTSRIFHIFPGKDLHIKNMALKNATSVTNGGALLVEGDLTLDNVLLQNNFENGTFKGMTVISPATVMVIGNVDIKN